MTCMAEGAPGECEDSGGLYLEHQRHFALFVVKSATSRFICRTWYSPCSTRQAQTEIMGQTASSVCVARTKSPLYGVAVGLR